MPASRSYATAAGIGALATAGLLGCLYAAHRLAPAVPFPAFAIADLIIRLTPGAVATAGIERLGEWARPILRWVGVFLMLAAGAGLTTLAAVWRLRFASWARAAGLMLVALLLTAAIRGAVGPEPAAGPAAWAVLIAGYAAWAAAVVWATDRTEADGATAPDHTAAGILRRRFLLRFGVAALGLAALGFLWGRRGRPAPSAAAPANLPPVPMTALAASKPPSDPALTPAATPLTTSIPGSPAPTPGTDLAAFVPAAGTRPNITPLPDFFVVNIGAEYPHVDLARWRLEVKGLVERPLMLTFEDVLALPRVDIHGTLACISNEVGGRLIATTLFSAARLADVLRLASPRPEATTVIMRAADRYDESLPLSDALHEDTLLVYGMDGKILMPEHGYPLRVYNPNRYGMKGPKWLTSLELVAEPHTGYWARLGWDGEAIVKITSFIDGAGAIRAENGVARIGGIAFAGWRGIQEVGVQINGGEFRPALLDRPLSRLTWVRWRYDWYDPPRGTHTIVVRAIDGDGEEQIAQPAPPHPDGASGWHKVRVTIG